MGSRKCDVFGTVAKHGVGRQHSIVDGGGFRKRLDGSRKSDLFAIAADSISLGS